MLAFTHFSIPFYSHFLPSRWLGTYGNKRSLCLHSCLIGIAGLLPDFFSIHVTLTARHNSLSHTILAPVIIAFICTIFWLLKRIPGHFIFWLPFAVSTHLFLDAISGGIRLLYPDEYILGSYIIIPNLWVVCDVFFLLLFYATYRYNFKNTAQKAEQYN